MRDKSTLRDSMTLDWLATTHLVVSFYMLGVIWVIQLIHYPGFLAIDPMRFVHFHEKHTQVMGLIVGPVMLVELATAIALAITKSSVIFWLNVLIVVALWVLTFFVSVPLHNKLSAGFSESTVAKLVRTNWPRTALWTLKAVLVMIEFRSAM